MTRTDYLGKRPAKHPSFVAREIADEMILVPIRQKSEDLQSIYSFNQVASRIWQLINGERRTEQIRDIIVAEYEVSQDEAEADLVELLQQLEQIGAVRVV
jgi:hypothetical protein